VRCAAGYEFGDDEGHDVGVKENVPGRRIGDGGAWMARGCY
jgi:hypothetical protein